jgi:aminocarboxymuconate-semialdehyde decarboxylase
MLTFFVRGAAATAREKRLTGAVDTHSHFVPRTLPPSDNRNPRWPSIEPGRNGEAAVTIAGKPFRRIDARSWDAKRRIEDMAEDGIARQVVSPMPELLSYWFPRQDADDFAQHVNHALAELCAHNPASFIGLGMVPLQDPALAARRLGDLKRLGFAGVEIGTHVDGVALGDSRFDEFYAEAESGGLCLLVHPLHPAGVDRIAGRPPLAALAAFPLETALAATALLAHGVLQRFPRLRILLSHGGGALPWILPRLSVPRELDASLADLFPDDPRLTARKFYYDSILYDPPALRFIRDSLGFEPIVVGSDYPFSIRQTRPSQFAEQALAVSEDALSANAERWLYGEAHA